MLDSESQQHNVPHNYSHQHKHLLLGNQYTHYIQNTQCCLYLIIRLGFEVTHSEESKGVLADINGEGYHSEEDREDIGGGDIGGEDVEHREVDPSDEGYPGGELEGEDEEGQEQDDEVGVEGETLDGGDEGSENRVEGGVEGENDGEELGEVHEGVGGEDVLLELESDSQELGEEGQHFKYKLYILFPSELYR